MFIKSIISIIIAVSIPLIQTGLVVNPTGMMFTKGSVLLGDALTGSGIKVSSNGTINCGGFNCSANAYRCSISERTTPDTTQIVTTRNCTDEAGNLVGQNVTSANNPYPGMKTRTYATASKSGGIVTCANCNGINSTDINEATQAVIKTVGVGHIVNNNTNHTIGLTHRMVKATARLGHHIRSAYNRFGRRMRNFGRKMKEHVHHMFANFGSF